MKKYVIYAPHKCGSTIIHKILKDVFNLEYLIDGKSITIITDSGKAKLQFERFIRPHKPKNPVDYKKDYFIFIPRNPIGISISMFYSFGYTHNCPRAIKSAKEQELFYLERENIQNLGLHEFVNTNVEKQVKKIERSWNLQITNKTILPYELMISNFSKFLKELLQDLDRTSAYDKTYEKWKESFRPINDKSYLIETGRIRTHKRTTDIYEWKKKLSDEERSKYLSRFPFIQQYDDFLNNLL
jgi:hypothetical protein